MGKLRHGMGATSLKGTVPKPGVSQVRQGVLLLSKQARNTLGSSAGSRGEPHRGFTSEISVVLLLPRAVESSQKTETSTSSAGWTALTISKRNCLQNIPVAPGQFAALAA